ncbi:unnamed protein product, partial [Onchocerca ochengi]|uniref:DUF1758 domain-containing protein n=1 Tax=Onchocerca ochengi TaxID=42157 RepID=A0A182EVJ7_ONCOC
ITNSIIKKGLQQDKRILLLCKKINVVNLNYPRNQQKVLAVFDIGLQLSFISKDLAYRLRLQKTEEKELKIASFSNKTPKVCLAAKPELGVKIWQKITISFKATVIDYLTNEIQVIDLDKKELQCIKQQNQLVGLKSHWKQLDVLIGADYFFRFIQLNKIENLKSGFSLLHTIVGSGYTDEIYNHNLTSVESACTVNATNVLDIDQFWKLELIGIQEQPSVCDDEKALEHFKRNITKKCERYQVCWPWENSKIKLNDKYSLCLGRLKALIRRLQANFQLHGRYNEIIQEQLQSNIIEEVSRDMNQVGIIHYLPHHEVLTLNKSMTKLRIVYDASAHSKETKSLNDVLYRGPITLTDLIGVLLRFRMIKNVIVADIEKALLQIELHPSDRNCTRFLWLKDIKGTVSEENINCYRFKRVPFGVISPPLLLSATLNYHLGSHKNKIAHDIK